MNHGLPMARFDWEGARKKELWAAREHARQELFPRRQRTTKAQKNLLRAMAAERGVEPRISKCRWDVPEEVARLKRMPKTTGRKQSQTKRKDEELLVRAEDASKGMAVEALESRAIDLISNSLVTQNVEEASQQIAGLDANDLASLAVFHAGGLLDLGSEELPEEMLTWLAIFYRGIETASREPVCRAGRAFRHHRPRAPSVGVRSAQEPGDMG